MTTKSFRVNWTMTAHTKTPKHWRAKCVDPNRAWGWCIEDDDTGMLVCPKATKEGAELIVKCVNAHEELVALLRIVGAQSWTNAVEAVECIQSCRTAARALLAKLES